MIEALIIELLEVDATTGISANLFDSENTGQPVHHLRIPQGNSKNGVVFNVLSQTPEYKKGAMALHDYQVSFSIHHADDSEAATIAANLVAILEGWTGTYSGKHWKYTMLERITEGFNDDQNLPRKIVDFQFTREN